MVKLKYNVLLLLLFVGLSAQANKPLYEARKNYEKSYKVGNGTLLSIDNKFGKVEILPTDANEFIIKVEVIANGKTEDRAQKLLNTIDVSFSEGSSSVSCATQIGNSKNKNEEGFEVNYTVYMPEVNPLNISNSFGDVAMGNRLGDLNLKVSYGSMRVGEVAGVSDIKLSFGNGSIEKVTTGEVEIKYSDFEMERADRVIFTQGFSDIEIGTVNDIELESKYGDVEIETVHTIEADVKYSGFEIETLTGSLKMEASYVGDFSIDRVEETFTLIDIEGKFSGYQIGLASGLNANIEAEFSYASLKVASDLNVDFHYKVKESNKSHYKGKIGEGDPNKWIKVESGYGNLRLEVD